MFITSSNSGASPSSEVLAYHVPESPRPRFSESPRPHIPESPRLRVPTSALSTSPRPTSHFPFPLLVTGSLRCGRFLGDGDVTAQVDWVRGCRSRAKINLLEILMTARDFVEYIGCIFLDSIAFVLSMASFEDFRQLIILYYDANFINDEDFLLLYDMFSSRNPRFPYYEHACFNLNSMSEAECKAELRFEKKDLPALAEASQIPPSFKLSQGSIVSGMEGLCIFPRRLAYPCRFGDMVPRFGKPVPVWSQIL